MQAKRQTWMSINYAIFLAAGEAFSAGGRGGEQRLAGDGKFSSAAAASLTE